MNEVLIVTHPGDNLDRLIELANSIVKSPLCSHVVFEFNGVNIHYTKSSSIESIMEDYMKKLQNI